MTVRCEWAHAQFGGQRRGFAIVALACLGIERLGIARDFTEKTQRPRLIPPFLVVAGAGKGIPGERKCFIYSAGQHKGLAQKAVHEGKANRSHGGGLIRGALEKPQGLGDPAGKRMRVA